jgi:hypothetical protein
MAKYTSSKDSGAFQGVAKAPYTSPVLTVYGSVRDLTGGGSMGICPDSNGMGFNNGVMGSCN